jgi:hypothetical protein
MKNGKSMGQKHTIKAMKAPYFKVGGNFFNLPSTRAG